MQCLDIFVLLLFFLIAKWETVSLQPGNVENKVAEALITCEKQIINIGSGPLCATHL